MVSSAEVETSEARVRLGSYEFKKKGFPASICAIPTISQLP
jgi:hypothetical protein